MTRQMPAGSQVAFAKDWLERQNIESQTIDVAAHIDQSLSYEENIKSMKRQFGLGGGRSRQQAARGLTAAECDVAIGNFEAGFNGEVARDACRCGHPDACETKVAAALTPAQIALHGYGYEHPTAAPRRKPAARKPKTKVAAAPKAAPTPKKVVTTKPKRKSATRSGQPMKQNIRLIEYWLRGEDSYYGAETVTGKTHKNLTLAQAQEIIRNKSSPYIEYDIYVDGKRVMLWSDAGRPFRVGPPHEPKPIKQAKPTPVTPNARKPKATTKKKVTKTVKSQTIKRKKRSSQKTMSGKTKPQKKPKKRVKKCVRVTVKRHTRKCPTHRRTGR